MLYYFANFSTEGCGGMWPAYASNKSLRYLLETEVYKQKRLA